MAKIDSTEIVENRIFHKLLDVVPDLMTIQEAGRSKSGGYMDLGLDVLYRTPERLVIALSHYYLHPSGDMIPDPDMEIEVFLKHERAQALTYQDAFGYQSVDNIEGRRDKNSQRNLNRFLSQWLTNLVVQGHRIGNTNVDCHADGNCVATKSE